MPEKHSMILATLTLTKMKTFNATPANCIFLLRQRVLRHAVTRPGGGALPAYYGNALSKENSCTADWAADNGQNYVRRNAIMVLSGSYAQIPTATLLWDHLARGHLTYR